MNVMKNSTDKNIEILLDGLLVQLKKKKKLRFI